MDNARSVVLSDLDQRGALFDHGHDLSQRLVLGVHGRCIVVDRPQSRGVGLDTRQRIHQELLQRRALGQFGAGGTHERGKALLALQFAHALHHQIDLARVLHKRLQLVCLPVLSMQEMRGRLIEAARPSIVRTVDAKNSVTSGSAEPCKDFTRRTPKANRVSRVGGNSSATFSAGMMGFSPPAASTSGRENA